MSSLGRTDVERIVAEVLKNLSIEVDQSSTGNAYTIVLKFNTVVLSSTHFALKSGPGHI